MVAYNTFWILQFYFLLSFLGQGEGPTTTVTSYNF